MILSTETQADIRRLHDIWLARKAFKFRCEQSDILAAIELHRADAPDAQAVPQPRVAQASAAGPDAAESPVLHPQSSEAGLPEVTASGDEKAADAPPAEGAVWEDAPSAPTQDQPIPQPPLTADPVASEAPPSPDAAGEGIPASSPAPTTKSRIEALHAAHPEFTMRQAWEHLEITKGSLSGHSHLLKIHWAPELKKAKATAPEPPTTRPEETLADKILAKLAERPGMTARELGDELDVTPARINTAAARAKITLQRLTAKERLHIQRSQKPAPAAKKVASIEAEAVASPFAPVGDTAPKPVRRPKGKLFWLRSPEGLYLDRFCGKLVRDRREAWTGNEAQLAGCRRNYAIARDLVERPVEREPARA